MDSQDVDVSRKGLRQPRTSALEAWCTIAAFLIALGTWSVQTLIRDPGVISKSENRYLASLPAYPANGGGLSVYLRGLEEYLVDHLAFRESGIWLNGWVKLNWFGTSPHPQVLLGRAGWLYNERSFSVPCMATWNTDGVIRNLSALEDAITRRHLPMVVVTVPSKLVVYPEFLGSLRDRSECARARGDELRRALHAGAPTHRVDTWKLLSEARRTNEEQEPLFWSNDSHWSDRAALIVAKTLMGRLAPELWQDEDIRSDPSKRHEGDMSRMTGVPFSIPTTGYQVRRPGVNVGPTTRLQPYSSIRRLRTEVKPGATVASGRLVVLHDSFFDNVEPIVAPFFEEVWLINWNQMDVDSLRHALDSADFVVVEVAERSASRIMNEVVAPMISSMDVVR